jgi:hypothetical protein
MADSTASLARLDNATSAYLDILRDALPMLNGMVESVPQIDGPEPMADLRDSVRMTLETEPFPGTVSDIAKLLRTVRDGTSSK